MRYVLVLCFFDQSVDHFSSLPIRDFVLLHLSKFKIYCSEGHSNSLILLQIDKGVGNYVEYRLELGLFGKVYLYWKRQSLQKQNGLDTPYQHQLESKLSQASFLQENGFQKRTKVTEEAVHRKSIMRRQQAGVNRTVEALSINSQLINSIEDVAVTMENAFRELGNAMVVFKSKLEEIQRMNEAALNTTISDIIPKATKTPTKRTTKGVTKIKAGDALNRKNISLSTMIIPSNSPNIQMHTSYSNDMNPNIKNSTVDYAFDNQPTQQMQDFDIGFTIPDQLFQDHEDTLRNEFMELERERMKKINPFISINSVDLSSMDLWNKMGISQRSDYVENLKRKREELNKMPRKTNIKDVKNDRSNEQASQKFQNILNKRLKRDVQKEKAETIEKQTAATEVREDQHKVEITALISEVQKQSQAHKEAMTDKLMQLFKKYEA